MSSSAAALWNQLASCSSSSESASSRTDNDNDGDGHGDNARDETGGSISRCERARHHPQKDAVVCVCNRRDERKEALQGASCNNNDNDE
mmetsp:Transcript_28535/g.59789  ORF Transcript_28535/g.59789 Transcript_28535/m.59789 type:complete len:89 (+) Transcript_28535:95-361(+)|eukprot:CAMPEP_0168187002 /NCGR_PEP_ID=MMETSP0139_2-20121125/14768_1 /TAXON_ID=44445 /ORGANISM="Pseudo-nitzschia australis, Strain 10249 10 AB" /LENGTH=88 /DNA_ID=CAMNT_0008109117 /DNA_START=119 /DNA_END=385 /DNA_ORIENTATION=+